MILGLDEILSKPQKMQTLTSTSTNARLSPWKQIRRRHLRVRMPAIPQYTIAVASSYASKPKPTSRLEQLPPENRNLIYEFVLTHHEPLFGIKPGHIKTNKVGLYTKHIECATKYECSCENCYSKYEFNKLKYVSRMFYDDTRGLELRYNDVTFGKNFNFTYGDTSAAAAFAVFYASALAPPWQTNLRRVYNRHYRSATRTIFKDRRLIIVSLESDILHRDQLFTLCSQNPHLTVFWEIHGLSTCLGPDLINIGLIVYNAARGCDPTGIFNPFPSFPGSAWTVNVLIIRDGLFGGRDPPRNLRFRPQGEWHETAWVMGMKRLRKRLRFVRWLDWEERYDNENGLAVWKKEIRKWYKEGF